MLYPGIRPSLFIIFLFFLIPTGCSEKKNFKLQGATFENQWIVIQPAQPLHFTGSLTIDLYIKLHEYPNDWTTIIAKRKTDHKNEFSLRLKNKNNGHWYFGSESAVTVLRWDPEKLLPLGEWVRLTLVRDSWRKKLMIYKNCELKASKNIKPSLRVQKADVPITLLRQGAQCLHATLAEIRIWDRALSPGLIQQVFFGSDLDKHRIRPVAVWRFNSVSNISGYGDAFLQPEIFSENSL